MNVLDVSMSTSLLFRGYTACSFLKGIVRRFLQQGHHNVLEWSHVAMPPQGMAVNVGFTRDEHKPTNDCSGMLMRVSYRMSIVYQHD